MASVDILHPLADDTVQAPTVEVMVAYDLRRKESWTTSVTLYCTLKATRRERQTFEIEDPNTPGDHTFTFANVAAGKYEISAKALTFDDLETPIHVVEPKEPWVEVDPPPVPPDDPLSTTGTLNGDKPELEVCVYGLVPMDRSFWWILMRTFRTLSLSTSRSKKPFHKKFKPLGNWQSVASIEKDGSWSQKVDWDSKHGAHLMVRAKMRVKQGKMQGSRGSKRK